MSAYKSNAASRLRKQKKAHQRQIQQLKQAFEQQLLQLRHTLQPLLYSQAFYREAMIHLLTDDSQADSNVMIGTMVTQRWLQNAEQDVVNQLEQIFSWLYQQHPTQSHPHEG